MKENADKGMSRRRFMLGAVVAGAAAVAAPALLRRSEPQQDEPQHNDPDTKQDLKQPEGLTEDFLNIEESPRSYPMGDLGRPYKMRVEKDAKGRRVETPVYRKFGEPLCTMLGTTEAAPTIVVDFKFQLAKLMRQKVARMKEKKKVITQEQLRGIKTVFDSYDVDHAHRTDISSYRADIAHAIQEARAAIDINKLQKTLAFADIDADGMKLLKRMEREIDATAILTYALTEVMPTQGDNATGVKLFDLLLHTAGREYIDCYPALYDEMLSFGPYQFTSHALLDNGNKQEGASYIDKKIAKKSLVPTSVVMLKGEQHHTAAYLFAIYNLAMLVRDLDTDDVKALNAGPGAKAVTSEVVLEYIAAAHHLPVNARKAFGAFAGQVSAHQKNPKKHKLDPFVAHAKAAGVGDYVRKTASNRAALRDLHSW